MAILSAYIPNDRSCKLFDAGTGRAERRTR